MVTNSEFLTAIFGEDNLPWVHVTSFADDPTNIPAENRLRCWAGNYYSRRTVDPDANAYFTVSLFYCDQQEKARRRKALFRACYVVTLDDVHEKLPIEEVNKLPLPSYKLQTSPGSEQWGYILDTPCENRHQLDNLHDGLIANGLAPDAKDPGQKGCTRYVRLPEGVNSKVSKLVNGVPPKCQMLEWHPERKVTMEQLAQPFAVNLGAERREQRLDGAADLPDHPLLDLADIIYVKEVRSDGRFDITCPWVGEHTGATDDGSAIFTNEDGSIGFKCHHGACQNRTAVDLLDLIEVSYPGFRGQLKTYQVMKSFEEITTTPPPPTQVGEQTAQPKDLTGLTFLEPEVEEEVIDGPVPSSPPQAAAPAAPTTVDVSVFQQLHDNMIRLPHTEAACRTFAYALLKAIDDIEHAERLTWHERVRDHMKWSQADFSQILKQQREAWYTKADKAGPILDQFVYVIGIGHFFNTRTRIFMKPEQFSNGYCHIDEDIRVQALVHGRVRKVDAIEYAPGEPRFFSENGTDYINTWDGQIDAGIPGDPSPWLNHFDALGWVGEEKEHIINFLACTLQHPEIKINHAIILGGGEGIGKDLLLYPAMQAMGHHARSIQSKRLIKDHNTYMLNTKLLHINEVDVENYTQANAISNQLKELATSPPYKLDVNEKFIPVFQIRNIVNVIMGTNEALPMRMSQDTRRYFVVWSDLSVRGFDKQMKPEWQNYFEEMWAWLEGGGWRAVVHYLQNKDISAFKPRAAPKVTEALKDIQEASEDPLVSILRECVISKTSLFSSDLMTIKDIHHVLRSLDTGSMGYNIKSIPSIAILGKVMKQASIGKIMRLYKGRENIKVYALRNEEAYSCQDKTLTLVQYERQIADAKREFHLRMVGEGA